MASDHAGDSGDSSFFSSVLKALDNKKDQVDPEDIDEDGEFVVTVYSVPLGTFTFFHHTLHHAATSYGSRRDV